MIKLPVIECQKQTEEMAKGCPGCPDRVFEKKHHHSYKEFKKHISGMHRPILCTICSATCYGKAALDEHLGKVHGQNCVCKYCGKILLESYLKREVLVYLSSLHVLKIEFFIHFQKIADVLKKTHHVDFNLNK